MKAQVNCDSLINGVTLIFDKSNDPALLMGVLASQKEKENLCVVMPAGAQKKDQISQKRVCGPAAKFGLTGLK